MSTIDFEDGRTAEELAEEAEIMRGAWARILAGFASSVDKGIGKHDTFYRVQHYSTFTGAKRVAKELAGREELQAIGAFTYQARVVMVPDGHGGMRQAGELWVALKSDDTDGPVDMPEDGLVDTDTDAP